MSNEVSNQLIEDIREQLIKEIESAIPSFGEGWRQNARELVDNLRNYRQTIIGGRIFSEYLDGILNDNGIEPSDKRYSEIWRRLESPGTTG